MVIVKRSHTHVDRVFADAGEVIKEIAVRSVKCARCGGDLDPEAPGPLVRCAACGCATPRMVGKPDTAQS